MWGTRAQVYESTKRDVSRESTSLKKVSKVDREQDQESGAPESGIIRGKERSKDPNNKSYQ